MNNPITMLLLLAAICLLPAWLVGAGALGAAVGLYLGTRYQKGRRARLEARPLLPTKQHNVVQLRVVK